MEMQTHPLSTLFDQLGLANSDMEIQSFINKNAPIANVKELSDASFWSASQSLFLKEAKEEDADWAEVVDELDVALRRSYCIT